MSWLYKSPEELVAGIIFVWWCVVAVFCWSQHSLESFMPFGFGGSAIIVLVYFAVSYFKRK